MYVCTLHNVYVYCSNVPGKVVVVVLSFMLVKRVDRAMIWDPCLIRSPKHSPDHELHHHHTRTHTHIFGTIVSMLYKPVVLRSDAKLLDFIIRRMTT